MGIIFLRTHGRTLVVVLLCTSAVAAMVSILLMIRHAARYPVAPPLEINSRINDDFVITNLEFIEDGVNIHWHNKSAYHLQYNIFMFTALEYFDGDFWRKLPPGLQIGVYVTMTAHSNQYGYEFFHLRPYQGHPVSGGLYRARAHFHQLRDGMNQVIHETHDVVVEFYMP